MSSAPLAAAGLSPDRLRGALAEWASGVSVVTTRDGELTYGITVSSFTSLSLDPPLILVCVANRSRILPMIARAGRFAVSLLAGGQDAASRHFATADRAPATTLAPIATCELAGLPVIADALAHLACARHAARIEGDHTIVIGHVFDASARSEAAPLVYHRRRYRQINDLPDSR